MIIIADSGSTKTAWYAAPFGFIVHTPGINPVRDTEDTMREVVRSARSAIEAECTSGRASSMAGGTDVEAVYFYGAGCLPAFTAPLVRVLKDVFPSAARMDVESDLLGAARALCGRQAGIACILGTGSNSCLYDGSQIVGNTSPLGWILGDEGSGAVLGRLFVGDVLKRQMPASVCDAFLAQFHLTSSSVIESVYRSPQPNRYLASFVPFLSEHSDVPMVHAFLVREFRRFFVRNVLAYERRDLPVHFVGGVANEFQDELMEAADYEGFKVGSIERSPILKMATFHGCLS